MGSKTEGMIQDAKTAGTFVKNAGVTVILSLAVIVLSVSLVVSMVTARFQADTFTARDHKEFVTELKAERVDEWTSQERVNLQLGNKVEDVRGKVDQISQDVAVTKAKVTAMEREVSEIRSILLRGQGNPR